MHPRVMRQQAYVQAHLGAIEETRRLCAEAATPSERSGSAFPGCGPPRRWPYSNSRSATRARCERRVSRSSWRWRRTASKSPSCASSFPTRSRPYRARRAT